MMISETGAPAGILDQAGTFHILVEWGVLDEGQMALAVASALARGMDLERVLQDDEGVPKRVLVKALSEYYHCAAIEYDERMPIDPGLLAGLDGERLTFSQWFPVAREGETVVIAASDPRDERMLSEVKTAIAAQRYEFRVALAEDIQWFILDYLHAQPGLLIGTERTGLAYWRNTMAHWRTRLACYRNDLAQGRTDLGLLRSGLGLTALSDVVLRLRTGTGIAAVSWLLLGSGLALALFGLRGYLTVRGTRMRRPGHQTLVEVTAATTQFLEKYHDLDACTYRPGTKSTMLARLGDCIGGYSTILFPSPASRERTHLARERNVLAAQRTIAATYRTIYARARTGLAFIRTGVAFMSLGFGLLHYFGLSVLTALDVILIVSGTAMAVDGMLWYLPVRKEQMMAPRCGNLEYQKAAGKV
ncbi:MAG TPA: DUF202 domain-containing protein [Nitrospirota bacterium]|nr:DUF202 domain-containing protein [Nitrospirota bacterium]